MLQLRHRLLLLIAAIALGCVAGFVGQSLTGSPAWFLAVPGAVMFAWLLVADPTRCVPERREPPPRDDRPSA